MWVGGHYALNGRVTAGTVLVFLAYLASLYAPLNTMAYMASTLQHAAANADNCPGRSYRAHTLITLSWFKSLQFDMKGRAIMRRETSSY